MKVLTLDRKLKDDGDEVSESGKKRWGGKGGLKAKLFGSECQDCLVCALCVFTFLTWNSWKY